MKKQIYVRSLEKRDLPAIVSMEERETGVARPDYWEKRIEISEAIRPHWASLVAELDNRVVGFVLGRAGEFEFGLPGTVACGSRRAATSKPIRNVTSSKSIQRSARARFCCIFQDPVRCSLGS